jgi:hypothetical protein
MIIKVDDNGLWFMCSGYGTLPSCKGCDHRGLHRELDGCLNHCIDYMFEYGRKSTCHVVSLRGTDFSLF